MPILRVALAGRAPPSWRLPPPRSPAAPGRSPPGDVRLNPGPPITGTVGIGYTNADVREDLVAPICARRGLLPATVALGPIEDGARRVRATCG